MTCRARGVANPLHLQVGGAADSQVQGVYHPPGSASRSDLEKASNIFFLDTLRNGTVEQGTL